MNRLRHQFSNGGVLVWLLVIVFIIMIIINVYIFYSLPLEIRKLKVYFMVGENAGFDVNNTALVFGRIPPGSSSFRNVDIGNPHNFPITAIVYTDSELDGILSVAVKEPIRIGPVNSTTIKFILSVPPEFEYGNYSGEAFIELKKAR